MGKRLYDIIVSCHTAIMSMSRSRASRVFTISFPEDLAQQVDKVAQQESRNISELFREAFRSYRLERIRRTLGSVRAKARDRNRQPYTEDDVERLVDEIRAEFSGARKTKV
jgi:predicted transcriptional regulator